MEPIGLGLNIAWHVLNVAERSLSPVWEHGVEFLALVAETARNLELASTTTLSINNSPSAYTSVLLYLVSLLRHRLGQSTSRESLVADLSRTPDEVKSHVSRPGRCSRQSSLGNLDKSSPKNSTMLGRQPLRSGEVLVQYE